MPALLRGWGLSAGRRLTVMMFMSVSRRGLTRRLTPAGQAPMSRATPSTRAASRRSTAAASRTAHLTSAPLRRHGRRLDEGRAAPPPPVLGIVWDEVIAELGSDYDTYAHVTHIGFAA